MNDLKQYLDLGEETMMIAINGNNYFVTRDQPVNDPKTETSYLLTPEKKRGAQSSFRLVRNQVRLDMLFPVGDKPFSPGGMPKWWVREIKPGVIQQA